MKQFRLILLCAFVLFACCLQGPWEYRPDDTPVFRGLTVNAYIIAGRPVTDFCVERLRTLQETYTAGFPFYDSASVIISGNGGSGVKTITLTPKQGCPNCFTGPEDFTGQPGEDYTLTARFTWDSSGSRAVSTITGTASIPRTWKCSRIAKVNAAAVTPADTSTTVDNPVLTALFGDLPPEVISIVAALYLPEIDSIMADTTALTSYFARNGERIRGTIDSLLSDDKRLVPYNFGDTLTYMSGSLNLLPHYFSFDYSNEIAGMLITHTFEKDAIQPVNSFDQFAAAFGPLEPAFFYEPGTEYRLQFLPLIEDSSAENPLLLFNNVPLSNGYLKGGKNTFYFYGTDHHYADFVTTYIEQHSASNVTPLHSVTGAQGYFVGMSLDSFVVNITIPPDVQAYTTFEAHAAFCSDTVGEKVWNSKDCRCFEPTYCEEVAYNEEQYAFDHPDIIREPALRNNCLAEAVAHYLEEGKDIGFVEDSILTNGNMVEFDVRNDNGTTSRQSRTFSAEELARANNEGLLRYCIRDEFGDSLCSDVEASCKTGKGESAEALYTYCEDTNWQPSPCRWATALYCREKANPPKELCEKGNTWCKEHPEDDVCK